MRPILGAVLLLCAAVLLSSTDKPAMTPKDKAFYLDQASVNFVRPGLVLTVVGATVSKDGIIQAQYTITDPKGLPLDQQGITTPGSVSVSFVASYIPRGSSNYIAYTKRAQTSSLTGVTAIQPAADSGGTAQKTADGAYTYTFGTKVPAYDASTTTSIGVYATRDLSEFGLGTYGSDSVFTFVPGGTPIVDLHDEIFTDSCNKCHDPLMAHGGARRSIRLCVLCHNPGGGGTQTIDPDTGNSIDLKVMAHKIHMGAQLPTVQAGTPYVLIGFGNVVHDYSTVVFPAEPNNCQWCHQGTPPPGAGRPGTSPDPTVTPAVPPVHANFWLTNPNRAACGACHDDVDFATGKNHANLPQVSDAHCTDCHIPQGELPLDVSIINAHTPLRFTPGLPGVVFTMVKVQNGTAGGKPIVTFTLKDSAGNPIDPSSMNLLNLVMAGPTADYASYISEDARKATGANGTYTYTFNATVPTGATGTYTIGIEGYKNAVVLPGTVQQQTVRDVGYNRLIDFSVDNTLIQPHAVEISGDQCNKCHYALALHGTIRQNPQYCLLCHNPNGTDQAQRPPAQNPAQSIDLPILIHRIHTGDQGDPGGQLTPYVIYGFGGSPSDFSDVRYPADLRDCGMCHVNNSEQLPLPPNKLNVVTPRGYINPAGPTTAACTACHLSKPTAAHASLNTSPSLGESCVVCHGTGAEFAVDRVHARTF